MNLLITGGAGFIGSNLIRHVIDKPEVTKLVNLDCLTYAGHLENLAGIHGVIRVTSLRRSIYGTKTKSSASSASMTSPTSCTSPLKVMWTAASPAPAISSPPTSTAPSTFSKPAAPTGLIQHPATSIEYPGSST
jgi:hypothetical protein